MANTLSLFYDKSCSDTAGNVSSVARSLYPHIQTAKSEIPPGATESFLDSMHGRPGDLIVFACEPRRLLLIKQLIGRLRSASPNSAVVIACTATSQVEIQKWEGQFRLISGSPGREAIRRVLREFIESAPFLPTGEQAETAWRVRANLIGSNPGFLRIVNRIPKAAALLTPVLITGESGTGKELVARALHYVGPRKNGPFVAVQCAAVPPGLFENELFGHEAGAYTGADHSRGGLALEANRGTLFLDEVESLPMEFQAKILRLVEMREYRPVGSSKEVRADIRIVSATNANLEDLITAGKFREDLYYRIMGMNLDLPPLRERRDDIPELARFFINKCAEESGQNRKLIPSPTLAALTSAEWRGNVRELAHVVARAFQYCEGPALTVESLGLPISRSTLAIPAFKRAKAELLERFEREYMTHILLATDWNISEAARKAEVARPAFWRKMRDLGIAKPASGTGQLEGIA